MKWFEDKLDIQGLPEGYSATISGTLVHGIVQINIDLYDDNDHNTSLIEWTKAIPVYTDDTISYDDIRQKYWNQVLKSKAKHEAMPYPMWREYMKMKVSGVSRL